MRLVLSRWPGQAGGLKAAAVACGFDQVFLPVTRQVLPADTSELTRAIHELARGGFDWMVLTSATTVRALIACGWSGQLPATTQVIAVGPGTAAALAERSDAAQPWMPQDYSAAGILAELGSPTDGQRMLLPQSAQARPALAEGLVALGWELTHVQAYQTTACEHGTTAEDLKRSLVPVPPADFPASAGAIIGPGQLRGDDVVLLTSSSAAEAYAVQQPEAQPVLLAIGEPTAATMRQAGLPVAAVLTEPTGEGLARALDEHRRRSTATSLDWAPDARTPRGGD